MAEHEIDAGRPEAAFDEEAHDVLAAEAFAVPAPDPTLHHGPISLPADPTGIEEPHDVLAAEEFPMPAPRGMGAAGGRLVRHARRQWRGGTFALAGVLVGLWLARLLLRRR